MRLLFVLLLSVAVVGQGKRFAVTSTANDATANGVAVNFVYSLPADNESVRASKTFPDSTPTKIVWLWGDEQPGAAKKDFSEFAWPAGSRATHTFAKPGRYGVVVVVVDRKGRLVEQSAVTVIITQPVTVE